MAWYKAGTVSVTSGSPTVTGSGTSWVANVKAGHGFIGPDRFTYEILSVDSNTQLTLAEPYASASDSGEPYKIVPTQGIVQTLATAAQTLINDFAAVRDGAGEGQFGDGNVSTPGVRFAADLDTGFYRPGTNSIGVALAGADRLRLTTTGLGIGTTTPLNALHITSTNPALMLDESDAAGDNRKWRASVSGGSFALGTTNDANDTPANAYVITRSGTTVTGHSFLVGGVTGLQMDASGDVGMGVAPQARLHVQASGTDAKLRLQSTSVGNPDLTQTNAGLELVAADSNTTNKYMPAIKFGSTDGQFTTTNPKFGAVIAAEAAETYSADEGGGMTLTFHTAPTAANGNTAAGVLREALRLDSNQNAIWKANTAAPSLTVNQTMVFSLTTNTNLRVSVRGTDGVTRVANLTLA